MENGAEGNIWNQEGRSEEKDSAGGNVLTQEGGSEKRIVLGGMFGSKREEVRGGCC